MAEHSVLYKTGGIHSHSKCCFAQNEHLLYFSASNFLRQSLHSTSSPLFLSAWIDKILRQQTHLDGKRSSDILNIPVLTLPSVFFVFYHEKCRVSRMLILPPILNGRYACPSLELAWKMAGLTVTAKNCHFRNIKFPCRKQLLCVIYALLNDIILWWYTKLTRKNLSEIDLAYSAKVCKARYSQVPVGEIPV